MFLESKPQIRIFDIAQIYDLTPSDLDYSLTLFAQNDKRITPHCHTERNKREVSKTRESDKKSNQ